MLDEEKWPNNKSLLASLILFRVAILRGLIFISFRIDFAELNPNKKQPGNRKSQKILKINKNTHKNRKDW